MHPESQQGASHTVWGRLYQCVSMKNLAILTALVGLTLAASGCAHEGRLTPRAARTMIAVGTVMAVTGALVAIGCNDEGNDGESAGCSGDPGEADLAVGLPVLVAGTAMLTTGIALRPPAVSLAPRRQLPSPILPDPFVKPLAPP